VQAILALVKAQENGPPTKPPKVSTASTTTVATTTASTTTTTGKIKNSNDKKTANIRLIFV
jgi:hypothetical protein